ncbi:unnamed protein product [Diatraea saccharalis]|uniref:Uncharacterized protein n=1 Tax=Diatraea saccharalis TaxID=40085 RepID=A0A9N9R9T8_9NEOP|nr:unnamed protein product [Diatraea saccharalis]
MHKINLSFGYPKSDTCATCDAGYSNEEHKANYYAAVEAMQVARKKPTSGEDVLYITVDLQQTMPLPKLTTSKAFYLRQVWFYNLGIHVIDGTSKEKAVCCTWTEDVADRGSSEVASALLKFVEAAYMEIAPFQNNTSERENITQSGLEPAASSSKVSPHIGIVDELQPESEAVIPSTSCSQST